MRNSKGQFVYCGGKKSEKRDKPCPDCEKLIMRKSDKCRSCSQSGNLSHFWKGGVTPLNKIIRQSQKHKNWRESVFARDNYTCQICNKRGNGEFHSNHIKKFSDHAELRFKIDNGITLCRECHFGLVNHHEHEWESYFNFNIETRTLI